MVAHGVPDGVIASQGFGETRLAVDTANGVREPQNRRVEITFTGSGSAPAQPDTMAAPTAMPMDTTTTTTSPSTDTPAAPPPQ